MKQVTKSTATLAASLSNAQRALLTILRIAIGWHLLYEGAARILSTGWSSASHLQTSTGFLGGFFRWIAASPWPLRAFDLASTWGLALIGVALILGCFARLASLAGIAVLALHYLSNPPMLVVNYRMPVEGRYFVVDKNFIELIALVLLSVVPTRALAGLDALFGTVIDWIRRYGRARSAVPGASPNDGASSMSRRELVANLTTIPVLGLFGWGAHRKHEFDKVYAITDAASILPETALKNLKGELPAGNIGQLSMTRLIMGCNLFGGWSHARDLIYVSSLFKAYHTEKKVFETIELAERAGINMLQLIIPQYQMFHRYSKCVSSKMQTMCQVHPREEDLKTDIDLAIDAGATTLYIIGGAAERFLRNGKVELIGKALDYMKSQGYVSGLGAHSIEVPIAAEKAGLNPDYYVKTLHHDRYWSAHPREKRVELCVGSRLSNNHDEYHDNMFDLFPERTIEFMGQIRKPWVAFKVLAGGAIRPEDGFQYAFDNGADFICVGMFDFQIVDDINITLAALSSCTHRTRPWLA
jgi:uncharacterized membrane protein YphA (DoxX/SURF4 family)